MWCVDFACVSFQISELTKNLEKDMKIYIQKNKPFFPIYIKHKIAYTYCFITRNLI